jgi:hypothetical protein
MKTIEKHASGIFTPILCFLLIAGLAGCNDGNEAEENDLATTENTEAMNASTERSNYYFSEWDSNGDGYLDPDEYSGGFFTAWDTNGDRQLDESEWQAGYERMGQSGLSWADWDINTDGFLSEGEYRQGYDNAGWYKAWDTDSDNRLSEQEYNEGMARGANRNE